MWKRLAGEAADSFITAASCCGQGLCRAPAGLQEPLGQVTSTSMWADGRNLLSGKVYPVCWSSPEGLSHGEQDWFLLLFRVPRCRPRAGFPWSLGRCEPTSHLLHSSCSPVFSLSNPCLRAMISQGWSLGWNKPPAEILSTPGCCRERVGGRGMGGWMSQQIDVSVDGCPKNG